MELAEYLWRCTLDSSHTQIAPDRINPVGGCKKCTGLMYATELTLKSKAPSLLEEWDYVKNEEIGITPDTIFYRSQTMVNWVCPTDVKHLWKARPAERIKGRGSCQWCSGKKVVKEKSLAYLEPHVAEWWNEESSGLNPKEVTPKSKKILSWRCPLGHKFECAPKDMGNYQQNGCPRCQEERPSSFFEAAILFYYKQLADKAREDLVNETNGLEFRTPQGSARYWGLKFNEINYEGRISKSGDFAVITVPDLSDYKQLNRAVEKILNLKNGCINSQQDAKAIMKQFIWKTFANSLEARNEVLSERWDYLRNFPEVPWGIAAARHDKFWFLCEANHSSSRAMHDMFRRGGCSECATEDKLLIKNFPEVAAEIHPSKNFGIEVNCLTSFTQKKIWWICDKNHEWEATVANRTNRKSGCPYCSGRKTSLENSIATTHPDVAAELHPNKNNGLKSETISRGSHQIVWWKCFKGHEWQDSVNSRCLSRTRCPQCYHPVKSSFPEQAIGFYLSKFKLEIGESVNNFKVGKFMIDNYLPKLNIAVEYDGGWWHSEEGKDEARDLKLIKAHPGLTVIRIREWDAASYDCKRVEGSYALKLKDDNWASLEKTLKEMFKIIDTKVKPDINLTRDRAEIYTKLKQEHGKNSFKAKHPDLLHLWSERNHPLKPEDISAGSGRVLWWKCEKGHEWETRVVDIHKGYRCSFCAGKQIRPEESLQFNHPEIASLWIKSLTAKSKTPKTVKSNSNNLVVWQCPKEKAHTWKQRVAACVNTKGVCPHC